MKRLLQHPTFTYLDIAFVVCVTQLMYCLLLFISLSSRAYFATFVARSIMKLCPFLVNCLSSLIVMVTGLEMLLIVAPPHVMLCFWVSLLVLGMLKTYYCFSLFNWNRVLGSWQSCLSRYLLTSTINLWSIYLSIWSSPMSLKEVLAFDGLNLQYLAFYVSFFQSRFIFHNVRYI